MQLAEKRRWRFNGPEMEGPIARWYTRVRGTPSQLGLYRRQASELIAGLAPGSRVLEVAPGPGYLAIEIARAGDFAVTGLDISHTFVEIARANARKAEVAVDFHQGDVAQMPFASGSFDLIVCQAAFKNFTLPHSALAEMHRVLRPGGTAVIQDMSRDATHGDIDREVGQMELGRIATFTTKATLEMLKRRAYASAELARLAANSPFGTCEIKAEGIGLEIRLTKEENR